jgi:hypothetical protein
MSSPSTGHYVRMICAPLIRTPLGGGLHRIWLWSGPNAKANDVGTAGRSRSQGLW